MKRKIDPKLLVGIEADFKSKSYSKSNPLDVYSDLDLGKELKKVSIFLKNIHDTGSVQIVSNAAALVLYKFSNYGALIKDAESMIMDTCSSTVFSTAVELCEIIKVNPARMANDLKEQLVYEVSKNKVAVINVIANFLLYFNHLWHIFDGKLTASQMEILKEAQNESNNIC